MNSVAHHRDVFKHLPAAENHFTWPDNFSFGQQTYLSEQHLCSDAPCPSSTESIPCNNALGLLNMCGSEYVWTNEQIPPLSTMPITSNSFSTPFSHQPPTTSDSLLHYGQPSVPYDASIYQEPAFASVQEMSAPHLSHAVSPYESNLVWRPTSRSRRDRGSASRLLPGVSTSQSHYAPYPLYTQKKDTSTPTYLCQWSDGGFHLCGAAVVGTRTSIWRHLHEEHAVQLNTDKAIQTCMWETCGKSMRRESIARHILTVHFHNKVECPSCRTYFARRDSLQRHQRSCASRESEEATPQDACTVAPGV